MDDPVHVVCPHCDTINRVPRAKLASGGKCGECHRDLFEGHPVALDTARFDRHAGKGDIPLLVDFWAEWCGPCRMMAPEFERAASQLEPAVRLVKVNVDEQPALAQRFNVRSIPTLALIHHGREIGRSAGARSAADLAQWVRSQLADASGMAR